MNKLIFLIAAFVLTIFGSCKKDVPAPVPKQDSLSIPKPIMDPSGHHYTPCDISSDTLLVGKLKKE